MTTHKISRKWKIAAAALLSTPFQPQQPPPIHDFLPSRHGFHFSNHFTGSPLPGSLASLGLSSALPTKFGLCGGMSSAAADFFMASRPVPPLTSPPKQGEPLYNYLYRRQVESLGRGLCFAPVFAQWMALPDDGPDGAFARTAANLASIAPALDHKGPLMLGLVLQRTGSAGSHLWENHQVLAIGPFEPLRGRAWPSGQVHIYDPNFPENDSVMLEFTTVEVAEIRLPRPFTAAFPLLGIRTRRIAAGRGSTPIRGVFQMPYIPQTPPPEVK